MHDMPILELRIRKAVRRHGSDLLVATERPTALDGGAAVDSSGCLEAARYAPGEAARFLAGLAEALDGAATDESGFAAALKGAEDVAIVWGERIATGPGAESAVASLLRDRRAARRRRTSPAAACSRSRSPPTAAASARPAPTRTWAPAWPRSSAAAATPTRSARRSSPASSRR